MEYLNDLCKMNNPYRFWNVDSMLFWCCGISMITLISIFAMLTIIIWGPITLSYICYDNIQNFSEWTINYPEMQKYENINKENVINFNNEKLQFSR